MYTLVCNNTYLCMYVERAILIWNHTSLVPRTSVETPGTLQYTNDSSNEYLHFLACIMR